jgi:hypothetical protein
LGCLITSCFIWVHFQNETPSLFVDFLF